MLFSKNGQHIELNKTEQRLLRILVENRGAAIRRQPAAQRNLRDKIFCTGEQSEKFSKRQSALSRKPPAAKGSYPEPYLRYCPPDPDANFQYYAVC